MAPLLRIASFRSLTILLSWVLILSPGGVGAELASTQEATPPPTSAAPGLDITTEEGLRKRLDEIESRYEAACSRLAEAEWRRATRGAGSELPDLAGARRALAHVLAGGDVEEILTYWGPRRTVTHDPSLIRRVRLLKRARTTATVELDPEVSALADDLAAQILSLRFSLDGKIVSRAALQRIIEEEPDRAARRKAWIARFTLPASLTAGMARLVRLRAAKTEALEVRYYHHLIQEAQDLRPYWIFSVMELLIARSKGAYAQLTAEIAEGLKLDRLEPWDLDYAMRKRSLDRGMAKIWETSFPFEGAVPAARKLLSALGFDPGALPARILAADPAVAGEGRILRIPADVRIAAPDPDESGPSLYERLLRGHGLALQAAFTKQDAPMLKGYECLPGTRNGPYAEGMAETMAGFLRDPLFLEKQLGMDRHAIELFMQDARERELLRLRRLLLDLGMQYTLYVNPDADLGQRYRELYAKALDVTVGAGDPVSWEGDVDRVIRPASSQDRIIGATIAAELHQKIRAQFGDGRFGSGKTAAWLIERCYADGELLPLEERMARAFDGGFKFDLYLEALGIESPASAATN